MGNRWTRVAALSGVLFVALVLASVSIEGSTPGSNASASAVRAFYLAHQRSQNIGSLLIVLSVIVGLFFYGYLRAYLRRSPGIEWLASLSFVGAVIFGVSAAIGAGATEALTDVPGKLDPGALQALNVIQSDLSWPVVCVGLGVFYLAVGFAIVKSRALPLWLGWASFALGLVSASVVAGFVSFVGTGVWVLIVSILLAVRNPNIADAVAQPAGQIAPARARSEQIPSTV